MNVVNAVNVVRRERHPMGTYECFVGVVNAVNAANSQYRKGALMKSHKDLDVWRLAVDLATDVYEVTKSFPKEEQYGMVTQMRRSAISIASNIAEGATKNSFSLSTSL